MVKSQGKTIFTTVGIDNQTNKLVEKICKRFSLKKGEGIRLAFEYIDKAGIDPADAPQSVKAELSKINKRQDDIIRFMRNYEEKQLNPMIRVCHSIATRFDEIAKSMENMLLSLMENSQEKQYAILQKLSDEFGKHAEAINNQAKKITAIYQLEQKDNKKLMQLISLYTKLATYGVMDGKRKENLKADIINLINEK